MRFFSRSSGTLVAVPDNMIDAMIYLSKLVVSFHMAG
jgi:hypothetical protein